MNGAVLFCPAMYADSVARVDNGWTLAPGATRGRPAWLTAEGERVEHVARLKLVAEPDRHHPLGIDAGKVFEQDGCAVPAPVALPGDAQVRLLPLDRMVPEVDLPLAVLHHVVVDAAADGNHRGEQRGIDVEHAVNLFKRGRVVALQPQQVFHATPPNRREPDRSRALSQIAA